jgi:hypothetical protein
MFTALAKAFHWQCLLDEGVVKSGSEIVRREGLHPTSVNELLRLTLLSPAVMQAVLARRQPRALASSGARTSEPPSAWDEQPVLFDGFDACGRFESVSAGRDDNEPRPQKPHEIEGLARG